MLTQLSTLKTRLRLNSFDLDDDPLLTSLINHASGRFAKECNRIFERDAGVTFEFRADRKSTRLNSSHANISYAVFCLKKKKKTDNDRQTTKTTQAITI